MTTIGITRTSLPNVSFTDRLSLALFGCDAMGLNVPSKSRNRIRRSIGIAASRARSDTMGGSSPDTLQVVDFNINIAQTTLGPVINIVRAEMKTHQSHPLSPFMFGHL
jgi:hypothetical protein